MRVAFPHPNPRNLAFVLGVLLFAYSIVGAQPADDVAAAPAHAVSESRPVLLVSSQHRLPDALWTALFTALQANLPEAAAQVPVNEANPEFLRADDPAIGNLGGQVITVYLRGDCRPSVQKTPFPWGARLGWVDQLDGVIVPIIHVECTHIGEEIAGQTQWMNREERTAAMSEGIARVVLHEWVHVATQSAAHGSDGVTKARFGIDDLLCGDVARNCGVARR
jgi:hypothetical protein